MRRSVECLPEFLVRVFRHWLTGIGTAFDLLSVLVAVAFLRHDAAVSAQAALSFFLVVLLASSFLVFQEERRKNMPKMRVHLYRGGIWPPCVDIGNGELEVLCSVAFSVTNSREADRITGASLTWEAPRFFGAPALLFDVPLIEVDYERVGPLSKPFALDVPARHETGVQELYFRGTWRVADQHRPRGRTRMFFTAEFRFSAPMRLEIGQVRDPDWNAVAAGTYRYWTERPPYAAPIAC